MCQTINQGLNIPTNKKDPFNTIERLTNALEAIATSEKSAQNRFEMAQEYLLPLRSSEFPEQADRELFYQIMNEFNVEEMTDQSYSEALNSIWQLYWNMTANSRYK